MTKTSLFAICSIVALSIVGCDSKPTASNNANSSTLEQVSTEGNNATAVQDPGLDLSKIPASIKNDAFEYYGLGRSEPIKLKVTQGTDTSIATQTVKLTKVDADSAEFTITGDGALASLGDVKVKLDKDGIRVVSVKGVAADSNSFELPTGLKKGKTWPFKLPGTDLKLSGTNTVGGTETVKTEVGTYNDALLVISSASGEQNGQKIQSKMKQWLVKGRGQVKAEITNVSGKNVQKVTMEETK